MRQKHLQWPTTRLLLYLLVVGIPSTTWAAATLAAKVAAALAAKSVAANPFLLPLVIILIADCCYLRMI